MGSNARRLVVRFNPLWSCFVGSVRDRQGQRPLKRVRFQCLLCWWSKEIRLLKTGSFLNPLSVHSIQCAEWIIRFGKANTFDYYSNIIPLTLVSPHGQTVCSHCLQSITIRQIYILGVCRLNTQLPTKPSIAYRIANSLPSRQHTPNYASHWRCKRVRLIMQKS